jgi:uncharacterized protein (DUF1015 family)
MAVVRPLAALHYDAARVGGMERVIAPPYDVISPAQQQALHERSPWNVIRLILPREADRGAAAARALGDWVRDGILVRDPAPAVYLYSQEFMLADGRRRRRDGVLCRLRLEDFSRGVVRPHERTFPGPKADRLAILRATGANLSPIFGLFARPGERVRDVLGASDGAAPMTDAPDDAGAVHRVWRITDPAAIERLVAWLAPEAVIIADGHHRYETALAYRAEHPGSEPAAHVFAFLANMEEEGVVILPTHRLVRGPLRLPPAELERRLGEAFDLTPLPPARPRTAGEIDVVLAARSIRLRARPEAAARLAHLPPSISGLDVAILHGAILEPLLGLGSADLDFTHDDAEALHAVRSGHAAAAFLLNPPGMAAVRAVCLAGEVMPEKSTYFFPKVATGLLFSLVGPPWV